MACWIICGRADLTKRFYKVRNRHRKGLSCRVRTIGPLKEARADHEPGQHGKL